MPNKVLEYSVLWLALPTLDVELHLVTKLSQLPHQTILVFCHEALQRYHAVDRRVSRPRVPVPQGPVGVRGHFMTQVVHAISSSGDYGSKTLPQDKDTLIPEKKKKKKHH